MRRVLLAIGVALLGTALPGLAPVPVRTAVKPGQVAVSKADRHGLVTMLRPVVTRLPPEGPFRVALHWAHEKRPLKSGDVAGALRREASLCSMTFQLTGPRGEKYELRPAGPAGAASGNELSYAPTFLLTLSADGIEEEGGKKWGWAGGKRPDLTREGAYRLSMKGSLVREKEEAIPFQSEPVGLEVSRAARPQARTVEIARAALRGHRSDVDLARASVFVREDDKGNALVRFRTAGRLWSYLDFSLVVKPDGKAGAPSTRESFTCVARGTPVGTERGPKAIEEVRVGDRVWGYDVMSRRRVLTTVRFVRVGEATQTLLFRDKLRVTAEHPLWVGEWLPAARVGERDRLLDEGLRRVPAGRPRLVAGRVAVYDLSVDEPHSFFAAGYLVHNKKRLYSPALDDPWYDCWPEHLAPVR